MKHEDARPLLEARATISIALAATCLGLLALYAAPRAFQDFGFIPSLADRRGYSTVLTALLLHGSLPHLATSVYFLLTFGSDVEHLLGTARFLVLLVLSAAAGDYAFTLLHAQSTVPFLGLGPAVSGLLAAYGLRIPRARIGFVLRLPVVLYRWVNFPAWVYILFWIVAQAIGSALDAEDLRQVSWSAHLGGALAGAVLGALLGYGRQLRADTDAGPTS